MPQVLVQFEASTLAAIDRLAPAAKRQRAEFIRTAVKDAIFRHEQQKLGEAYRLQPDNGTDTGHWEMTEEWSDAEPGPTS